MWFFRQGVLFLDKVFLEIWQNSQENTRARVSFLINLQALGLCNFIKKETGTGAFMWILSNF